MCGSRTGFGAEQGRGDVGGSVPVGEKVSRGGVEELEPGDVRRTTFVPGSVVENIGEYSARPRRLIARTSMRPLVTNAGPVHGVEQPLDPLGQDRRATPPRGAVRRPTGTSEVEQVGAFGLVECSARATASRTIIGDTVDVALLQPGVPVGADSGQHGDLLTRGRAPCGARRPATVQPAPGDSCPPAGEEVGSRSGGRVRTACWPRCGGVQAGGGGFSPITSTLRMGTVVRGRLSGWVVPDTGTRGREVGDGRRADSAGADRPRRRRRDRGLGD